MTRRSSFSTVIAETAIRVAIGLTSIAVAVVLVLSLARNTLRILSVWIRGHGRLAFTIAVADPALNGYLCFVGFIFALYI